MRDVYIFQSFIINTFSTDLGLMLIHANATVSNPYEWPITAASRFKAWTVFARSNTAVVGSNPTRGMDICVYSFFVLPCV
jgi:hypothetical protein